MGDPSGIPPRDAAERQPWWGGAGLEDDLCQTAQALGLTTPPSLLFVEYALGPGGYERSSDAFRGYLLDNVHTLKKTLTLAPEPFTCDEAGKLGVPTLLVGGDASPRLFPVMMNALQPCLRTVERVTIPGPSHGVHLDNPVDFNRAVLEFVGHH
jgi:non-heme chloroperoxidase